MLKFIYKFNLKNTKMKIKNILIIVIALFISINSIKSQNTNEMETKILIKTSMGDITIKLYNETEYHKNNFIKLVNENFYDSLLFHRVIDGFMIQGGDPNSKDAAPGVALGSGGPGYTIPSELSPKFYHKKGALAAARTGDQGNPTRRSSGCQFYLVTGKVYTDTELKILEKRMNTKFTKEQKETYTTIGGTPQLDGQYTVFGEIISGLEIADKIAGVQKDKNDRPNENVVIIDMLIIEE